VNIAADPLVRNRGIISDDDHKALANAVVAIAGCGGDGGELAIALARMGICNFRLADPEKFAIENLNRQAGCYRDTIGRNKAEVIRAEILRIKPEAKVIVFDEGLTDHNKFRFVCGADLVVDEMEYTEHRLAIMLAREARYANIPNLMAMNVAWGCLFTSFQPNGITVEEFLGLNPEALLDEIAVTPVPLDRWLAGRIPGYADLEMVAKVAAGEMSAPSVVTGVLAAAAQASFEVANYICRWEEPVAAPQVFWYDTRERKSGILTVNDVAVS
jgi:hypothetical protein